MGKLTQEQVVAIKAEYAAGNMTCRKLALRYGVTAGAIHWTIRKRKTYNERLWERFWAKVQKGNAHECWEWHGARTGAGYGQLRVKGQSLSAHRLIWELQHGPIPEGLEICHHCDLSHCVNPEHLFIGTHQDNMQDMQQKGRGNSPFRQGRMCRGEENRTAKLTSRNVRTIRMVYEAGNVTQQALAETYGVTKSTIGRLLRRQSWAHVL